MCTNLAIERGPHSVGIPPTSYGWSLGGLKIEIQIHPSDFQIERCQISFQFFTWCSGQDFNSMYPLVNIHSLLLKMAIEIVDFPVKNG